MRQTLRKIVAVLALVGLSMNLVPSALAATTVYTDVSAANKLASLGIIVDKSANTADYRLGDTVLRQEAVKVVAGALGGILENEASYTCTGAFSDIANGTWVCRIAELAKNAGLVAANPTFRPTAKLSKLEAIIFALRSAELMPAGSHSTDAILGFAVDAQLISSAAGFSVNAPATRGEFFRYVARALDSAELPDICTIAPDLCGGNNNGGGNTGGAVSVSLSSSSPAGYTVPGNANGLHVASYRVTAAANTTLTSVKLKRVGLSSDDDVTDFTVLVNGARVTDPKDENSDDEVSLTFKNGGVRLSANQSVTLDVLLNVNPLGAGASEADTGAEFAVSLVEVNAGATVSGLPVTGSSFKVGATEATTIEVATDGSVTAPKLGQTGADLFRFKVENTSSNDTMSLHAITFEQVGSADTAADLKNFVLKRGSTVLATTAMSDGDYVTFKLATPLTLTQGNSASLRVAADIVGGAGETVDFQIDNKLDVSASSTRFGKSITVDLGGDTLEFAEVDVDAGAVTLIKTDATATKIREDKDDVVLGTLDIIAGQAGLEIKKIAFKITATGGDNVSALIEDVQVRHIASGARYDIARIGAAGASEEFGDNSFDLTLAAGSNKFEVIADTLTTITDFDTNTLTLSIVADQTIGGGNGHLVIEETSDDEVVTDVTPSALTWKKIDGSESGAVATIVALSSITKVKGASDVIAAQFEIEADESSLVKIEEIAAHVDANGDDADNSTITQVALYKGNTIDAANLLDTVSGSQLAAGVATFEGFIGGDVVIAADAKQRFTIVLSFVDGAATVTGAPYSVDVDAADIVAKDDQEDDIDVAGGALSSARNITIVNGGTLAVTVDNTDSATSKAKTVLGGTTSDFVASWEITVANETVKIEDLVITANETGETTAFENSADYVVLYKNDKVTEITREDVTSNVVTFDNINYSVDVGSTNVYAKVVAHKIGKEQVGRLAKNGYELEMTVTDATGVSSNNDIDVSAIDAIADTAVTPSNTFVVAPTRISSVAFVTSGGGQTVASSLTNGENIVAILKISTDSSVNNDGTDATTLKTVLRQLNFTIQSNATMAADSVVVERITGPGADDLYETTHDEDPATPVEVVTDLTSASSSNNEIDNGSDVFYAIKATVSGLTGDTAAYVEVKMPDLDDGSAISYSSDDSGLSDSADTAYLAGANDGAEITAATFEALNLSVDNITAAKVNQ